MARLWSELIGAAAGWVQKACRLALWAAVCADSPCGLRGGHLPRSSLAIPWALLRPLLRIKPSFATKTKVSST